MQLDEAVAIQGYILRGIPVQDDKLREAMKVIRSHHGVQGQNRAWMPEPMSSAQRDRVNMILIARLALACRKLDEWRGQGRPQ
jgi:hypothetical protein